MRVLAALGSRPRSTSRAVSRSSAAPAWLAGPAHHDQVIGIAGQDPSRSSHSRSSRCRQTLHITGLITPPWAVTGRFPADMAVFHDPGAQHRAQELSGPAGRKIRSSTASMSLSCGIAEKQEAMSVSTTRRRPASTHQ